MVKRDELLCVLVAADRLLNLGVGKVLAVGLE